MEVVPKAEPATCASAFALVAVVRRHVVDLFTPEQIRVLDEIGSTVLANLPSDD